MLNKTTYIATINDNHDLSAERKRQLRNEFYTRLKVIKRCVLTTESLEGINNADRNTIRTMRRFVQPADRAMQKDSVHYDLECSPVDYLMAMVRMTRDVEEAGHTIPSCTPLVRSIIPGHFTIDTFELIELLFDEGKAAAKKNMTVEDQLGYWDRYFKLNKRCFQVNGRDYIFNRQISTDGVSMTINLISRAAVYHPPITIDDDGTGDIEEPAAKKPRRSSNNRRMRKVKVEASDRLIDLSDKAKADLKKAISKPPPVFFDEFTPARNLNIFSCDRGKSDLLYIVNGPGGMNQKNCPPGKKQRKWRYSQNTRRRSLHTKRNRQRLQRLKRQTRVHGRTVQDLETAFGANHNAKTTNVQDFKNYILAQNLLNAQLNAFYSVRKHRNIRFGNYQREQITDARMVNSLKEFVGCAPENALIAMGNWNEGEHMRFHEPTKGIGLIRLLRKAGFHVYTVDEFRTSCRCSVCETAAGVCATFRVVDNPRPYRRHLPGQQHVIRHGLSRCANCHRLWNRDTNGASNIWKIANAIMLDEDRPAYLCRET